MFNDGPTIKLLTIKAVRTGTPTDHLRLVWTVLISKIYLCFTILTYDYLKFSFPNCHLIGSYWRVKRLCPERVLVQMLNAFERNYPTFLSTPRTIVPHYCVAFILFPPLHLNILLFLSSYGGLHRKCLIKPAPNMFSSHVALPPCWPLSAPPHYVPSGSNNLTLQKRNTA